MPDLKKRPTFSRTKALVAATLLTVGALAWLARAAQPLSPSPEIERKDPTASGKRGSQNTPS